jgi:hypothetical protein
MIQTLTAFIFPHAYLSDANLKRVLSFFDKVTLFQPWFLEKEPLIAREYPDLVEVANPREDFKPKEGYKSLLAEYRHWAETNYERGFPAFPAYARERLEDGAHTWEIRSMIRNAGKPAEEDGTEKTLKSHLALHLAEEMEEERQAAANLLRSMEAWGSPLKDAVEKHLPGFVEDLPRIESASFYSEERLAQILDAWFTLFGEKVQDRVPLITMNPQLMKFVGETWEEFAPGKEEADSTCITLQSPDLSPLTGQAFLERREALFARDKRRQRIAEFFSGSGAAFPPGADSGVVPESDTGYLRWTFLSLPDLGDWKMPKRHEGIRKLSGKAVGLVEEAHGR